MLCGLVEWCSLASCALEKPESFLTHLPRHAASWLSLLGLLAACANPNTNDDTAARNGGTAAVNTASGGATLSAQGGTTAIGAGGTSSLPVGGSSLGGSNTGGAINVSSGAGPGGSGTGGATPTGGGTLGGSSTAGNATGGNATGGVAPTPTFASADEEILYRAVRFYGAERCGDAHNWSLVGNPNGTKCHPRDGESVGLDLSGGWHDAGDHVKVTLTIAYAAYVMLKAYDLYPKAFKDYDDPAYSGKPNGIPDVLDEARFGLDWLVKAHPSADKLVAMVANSDYDHSTFMTSPKASTNTVEKGGEPRPVQMGAKADFAGLTAAALALASRVYASVDATLATTYLTKAKTAYAFAKSNPGLSTSMLYAWTGSQYTDDLMCGAAELWRATSEAAYRTDALAQNTTIGPHKYIASYTQVSDFCRHSLVKGGEQSALTPWTTDVDRYLTLVSANANLKGLIYLEKWGTCRHAMTTAFSAALLYDATRTTKYLDFARSQYAWVKGQNPQSRSFIIGWGTNPPKRPHHRNAYGYEDDLGWDADTPQLDDTRPFRISLVGALVGGPNLDGYQDSVNDYVHNEVALDYNAGLVGVAAFAVSNP